jgi:hypothetical protein
MECTHKNEHLDLLFAHEKIHSVVIAYGNALRMFR